MPYILLVQYCEILNYKEIRYFSIFLLRLHPMKQKRNNEVWRPTKSEFPQTPLVRFVSKYGEIENKQYNNHHSLCGIETADSEFVYLVDMSSVVFFSTDPPD